LAEAGPGKDPEDPRRVEAALRERYLGVALLALAILLYWSIRLFLAWLSG
jgi:hypothetical protein